MEIVKQRKKRLLAWILTLMFCVGMWQGSVQATGSDTEPEVLSEDGNIESQDVTTRNITIISDLSDGATITTNLSDWSVEYSSGKVNISNANYTGNALENVIITNTIQKNNTTFDFKHKVLRWYAYENGEKGNPLSEESTYKIGEDVGETMSLYGELGKSVAVTFWEGESSGALIGDKAAEPIIITQDNANTTSQEITLPNCDLHSQFFKGWSDTGTVMSPGTIYKVDYGNMNNEKMINIVPVFDFTISNKGSYSLVKDKQYYLEGSWKVGDYTYTGNMVVYAEKDGSYNFE